MDGHMCAHQQSSDLSVPTYAALSARFSIKVASGHANSHLPYVCRRGCLVSRLLHQHLARRCRRSCTANLIFSVSCCVDQSRDAYFRSPTGSSVDISLRPRQSSLRPDSTLGSSLIHFRGMQCTMSSRIVGGPTNIEHVSLDYAGSSSATSSERSPTSGIPRISEP
jgi:hypothetical protein